jgi:tRNA 2-thiocytidine biosynthesis protein TtcA
MQNIVPSHLADGELFDFKGLQVGVPMTELDGGDTVFDGPQFGQELSLPAAATVQLVSG